MDSWDGMLAVGAVNVSPLFALLTLVLVMAVLTSLVFVRFKQSLLSGYLLAGVLIGNLGLTWLVGSDRTDVLISHLAEIGVVLLMFTLGIEFSFGELRHLWRTALIGGSLQVGVTALLAFAISRAFGQSLLDSVVIGIALALSSTAVAMKSFQESGQQNNPGARAALGIALFQDLLVIVVFIVLPVFYLESKDVGGQLGWAVLKGALFLGGAALLGRYGITPVLHAVARTRSRELFTLTVIGLCAGVAFAGGALNLSLALGAFAAGLVVSESIYSHRILSEILPFRDLFLAIFFISVGLLIDLDAVAASWPTILGLSAAILIGKGLILFGALWLLRLPGRQALLAAASLSSSGEFTLVLIGKAGGYRPLDPTVEQALLVCTALTMACVPTLMRRAGPFSKWLESRGWMKPRKTVSPELSPHKSIRELADHAVICGYGPVGRSLNEALERCGMDTLVMELNSETVCELKRDGQRVLFADVTHPEALDLAGISRARLVAFTFPTVAITKIAVPLVRERNPGICIFARAKFANEAAMLHELGVQVIHDEHESAVAMVRAAISSYQRSDVDPDELVAETVPNL